MQEIDPQTAAFLAVSGALMLVLGASLAFYALVNEKGVRNLLSQALDLLKEVHHHELGAQQAKRAALEAAQDLTQVVRRLVDEDKLQLAAELAGIVERFTNSYMKDHEEEAELREAREAFLEEDSAPPPPTASKDPKLT